MPKPRRIFVCRSCGSAQSRWMGKCPDCGTWDALEEQIVDKAAEQDPQKGLAAAWAEISENAEAPGAGVLASAAVAMPIGAIAADAAPRPRLATGITEFDRVLGSDAHGAGLVPGSAVLVGGEPGIGKSTLLLQSAMAWARRGLRVLYVSSEESAEQIKLRAERLSTSSSSNLGVAGFQPAPTKSTSSASFSASSSPSVASSFATSHSTGTLEDSGPASTSVLCSSSSPSPSTDNLFILADTNLARIIEQTRRTNPAVVIIDSVQMIYKADLSASPGSIAQLRRCCSELVYLAKLSGISVVLVGHVTKDGQLAGPRLLEHLVDSVLYFEGDRYHAHRVVRAIKNRFGTTLEIGLFEMTGSGLTPVGEAGIAAAVVVPDAKPRPGCALCPVVTGSRCYLVEIQALTATGFLGAAKRKSSGLDSNRLAMLIAVLEQHAGLRLADRDVFASAVGGIRVVEPAADLALLLAIAGAHYKRALPPATAVIGEVGLGGEVRPVAQLEQRVREAVKLGIQGIIIPHTRNLATVGSSKQNTTVMHVQNVDQAIEQLS